MSDQQVQLSRRKLFRMGGVAAGATVLGVVAAGPAGASWSPPGNRPPGGDGASTADGASAGNVRTSGKTPSRVSGTSPTSYNGWPVGTPGSVIGVQNFLIPGTAFVLPIRSGDVATVLLYVASRFNREVEPLEAGQLFGYDYRRNVNNPSVWSNHASGTAIDLNADLHPNSVKNTFTAAQVAAIHRIVTDCDGVIFWGGDYTGTVDAMHFEINVPPGDPSLPALAAKIDDAATPGRVISLRAGINARYVTAEHAGASALIANRSVIGPWEQFDLLDRGAGNVALRAHANGLYVCADARGTLPLIANRTAIGPWETFGVLHNADGTTSLRAMANGLYVTAESAGTAPLIANRTAIGPWEKFDLIGG